MSNIANPRAETFYGFPQPTQRQNPLPIIANRAPTANDTRYPFGQSWIYKNNGGYELLGVVQGVANWKATSGTGAVISVSGTANQITATNTAGAVVLSLPSAITAPGSLTTTTSLSATTTITAGTGITATNGNLVLGTAGNKIIIPTGSNASVGTSAAMSGTPGVVTVATTACSATAKVFYCRATTGGTPGNVSITAQDGTGFTLTSTGNETSTFNWWIINA